MCFAAWSAGHGEYVRCVHVYTSRALSHSFSFKLLYLYTVCYLLCLLLIWLILEKHNLIFVVLLCWYNKMTIKLWLIDWLIDWLIVHDGQQLVHHPSLHDHLDMLQSSPVTEPAFLMNMLSLVVSLALMLFPQQIAAKKIALATTDS